MAKPASASMPESCASCEYFRPRAPTKLEAQSGAATPRPTCQRFPNDVEKRAGDWCGEHKRRTT